MQILYHCKRLQHSADGSISNSALTGPIQMAKPTSPLYRVTSYNFVIFTLLFGGWILLVLLCTFHHQITNSKNDYIGALSVKTHYDNLFQIKRSKKVIKCIDGIRSLSIFWVVIGHIIGKMLYVFSNTPQLFEQVKDGFMISVYTGQVAVDSFFLMGGLLTAYLSTTAWSTAVKAGPVTLVKSYVLFVVNRYARLTPMLALAVWSTMSFWPTIGNGGKFQDGTSQANFRWIIGINRTVTGITLTV